LLETVAGLAIGQMVAERATLVMHMAEEEDWAIATTSHKLGAQSHQIPRTVFHSC
jgi:hypothetical protein